MVCWLLGFYAALCSYGAVGIVSSTVGLRSRLEMYVFAVVHGFILGPIQAFTRTLYSDLVPVGRESEFFALYQVTDKGSSFIGPLVISYVAESCPSLHYGFVYLLTMIVFPLL